MSHERTVRDAADDPGESGAPERDVLYVVLCGDSPLAGGRAVAFGGADVVVIGRGPALRVDEPSGGETWLRVPDARVSERHAVLERRDRRLWLEDLGSLNGTFRNGEAVRGTFLEDGDAFAVGRTVLLVGRGIRAPLESPAGSPRVPRWITLSPEVARVHELLSRAAGSDLPVLLRGETGTGKEVAARGLHELSGRTGRFVAVNCGALPDALVESELFGHRKGAFSGADRDKPGLITAAHQGTLLLDEIGDLPAPAQVKLLRALQEREVVPVGATAPVKVDFRLVSATHQDLPSLVARGIFRADLYGRVRGLEVALPPLRDRRVDLGLLVADLLRTHAGAEAASVRIERGVAEALLAHDWPLNIRELEQTLQGLLALAGPERVLRQAHLAQTAFGRPPAGPAGAGRRDADPDAIRAALVSELVRHQGNVSAVARSMRRTRMQIHRWLERFGLDLQTFRGGRG